MKFLAAIFLILTLVKSPAGVNSDHLMGKWVIKNEEGIVEIIKSGDKYYGKIVWLKEANDKFGNPRTDEKNPDVSLQKRPLLGIIILHELAYNQTKKQWEGTAYSPRNGQTVQTIINLQDLNTINVMGYVGSTFFSKTEIWKRKI